MRKRRSWTRATHSTTLRPGIASLWQICKPSQVSFEMRIRRTSGCLLVLVGLVLCSCSSKEKAAEPEATEHVVTVDVAPVLSSSIALKVSADALLYPLQQAAIVPKIAAPVKKFYVDRGARVRAGQVLAELENRDLAGVVRENQAAYEQAEA